MQALAEEEVPVGCIFVYKGDIIGRGYNKVNATRNVRRLEMLKEVGNQACRDDWN